MKFILSAVLLLMTTVVCSGSPGTIPISSGSIMYPIVNATRLYTFEFVSATSVPASRGPSCTVCTTSNCANPCPSSASNSQNCGCVLAPNGYQWLDNMTVGEGQSISIVYNAKDSSGNYVGNFTVIIDVDAYTIPQISNQVGLEYLDVEYVNTTNNSTYSGPCWAIFIANIT